MRWFHNLSTLAKLLGTFTAVCIVMAVVGYMGIRTAQSIKTNLDDMGALVTSARTVGLVQDDLSRAQRDIRTAVLTSDSPGTLAAIKQMTDEITAGEQSWVDYKQPPFSPAEATLIPQFEQAYKSWHTIVDQAATEAAKNTPESDKLAIDLVLTKSTPFAITMNTALDGLSTDQATQAATTLTDATAQYEGAVKLLIGILVGGIVLSLGAGFFLARGIVSAVAKVARAARQIADQDLPSFLGMARSMADGDLTQHVSVTAQRVDLHSKDELGVMASDFNLMIDRLQETGEAFDEMGANLRDLVGQVQESANSLADTSAQLGSAAAQTGSAVQQVTMAVQNVASGAQETSRSAQETTAAVLQLSQVIDGIARGATDQARQVQTTSATATQMAAGVEVVAANASQVAAASQQTKIVAERGGQAVRETTAAMAEIQTVVGQAASKVRDLGTLGQKIGAVVETIDDIAEQTNLLALNAAIEAARAGEHGKGFAVVADEVRKLAERSGRETKQIAELIAQVQTGTKDAVGAMDSGAAKVELGSDKAAQAGQALEEILNAVQDTVRQVGEIASSSQQMAGGARSVTDAMHSISAVVEQSSAATEQMSAQANSVTGAIQSIAAVSEQQSAATEEVSASTEEMSAQVEQMSAQAQELAATAEQLKGLVSRFKLEDASTAAAGARKQPAKKVTSLRRAA